MKDEITQSKKRGDQRRAPRARVRSRLFLRAWNPVKGRRAEQPAILHDISLLGASMATCLRVQPGQWLDMDIPLGACPADAGLPDKLTGRGYVQRVSSGPEGTQHVAVRFGPSLCESPDMATYMGYLLGARPAPVFS